jgi:hypothetical protein
MDVSEIQNHQCTASGRVGKMSTELPLNGTSLHPAFSPHQVKPSMMKTWWLAAALPMEMKLLVCNKSVFQPRTRTCMYFCSDPATLGDHNSVHEPSSPQETATGIAVFGFSIAGCTSCFALVFSRRRP